MNYLYKSRKLNLKSHFTFEIKGLSYKN